MLEGCCSCSSSEWWMLRSLLKFCYHLDFFLRLYQNPKPPMLLRLCSLLPPFHIHVQEKGKVPVHPFKAPANLLSSTIHALSVSCHFLPRSSTCWLFTDSISVVFMFICIPNRLFYICHAHTYLHSTHNTDSFFPLLSLPCFVCDTSRITSSAGL